MPEPITIPSRKIGNIIYALGSLLFVLAGFLFLFSPSLLFKAFGLFTVAFFGWCFLTYCRRLFSSQPLLQVDQDGVTDHSSALAIGFIPWEDIQDIGLRRVYNQIFISISLKNQEDYLKKMSTFQRQLVKVNLKMGYPLVNISLNTSGKSPKAIFQAIVRDYGDCYDH